MKEQNKLNANSIAFIALAHEYCTALESANGMSREDFVGDMLRKLPRLYIMATDLNTHMDFESDFEIRQSLDEDTYRQISANVAMMLEPDDVYLEVFEEDMKYSDTPVSASISESLADLYQVFFNFISTVREASVEVVSEALAAVKDDFDNYWSQIVCNVMRPLNAMSRLQ